MSDPLPISPSVVPGQLTMALAIETADAQEFSVKMNLARQLGEVSKSRKALQSMLAEQQRLMAEMRAAEQRYRTLFEQSPEPVFLVSCDVASQGRIVDLNAAACRCYGYERDELLALRIEELTLTASPAEADASFNRKLVDDICGFECLHRRKGGESFPAEVNASLVDLDGQVYMLVYSRDITVHRRAETALGVRESRFRAITEVSPVPMMLTDEKGTITFINPAFERTFGYTLADLETLEAWWTKACPDPSYRQWVTGTWQVELERAQRSGTPFMPREFNLICRNGTCKTVLLNAAPQCTSAELEQMIVLYDITDRKEAEAALRESEARWRFAMDGSGDGMWDWRIDTGMVYCSKRWKSMLGYAEDELSNMVKEWEQLVHPEDLPRALDSAADHFRGMCEHHIVEQRMRCKDGSWKWILARGKVIEWTMPGKPRRMIGTYTDIDQAKRHEETQQALVRRLDLVIRASRIGVWELDLKTGRIEWDDAMYALYGVNPSKETVSVDLFRSCVHVDDLARVDQAMRDMPGGTAVPSIEFRILRREDGAIRVIEGNGYLLRDGNGLPQSVLGMNRDVTEQKEAEQHRTQLENQLGQAQKMETLGTLAGGIAHDFNNLLGGMLGCLELASPLLPAQHPANEWLGRARGAGIRARDLVKRLMLFSRRTPSVGRKPLQIGQMIDETQPILAASLPSSIVIRTYIEAGVGEVLADYGQLQQVFMNLCLNAAHAIGEKQGEITVTLRSVTGVSADGLQCPLGEHVCLSVDDDGCGMDRATQARIFDPFFTTKPEGQGTGLGLSIVHGIVHDHGGTIRLRSTPGQGTCFDVYLPVVKQTESAVEVPSSSEIQLAGAGHRVLLVDDEEMMRVFVSAVLIKAGFDVVVADNGRTGAELFTASASAFTFAIVDLSMHGRNGLELIADMRALRPGFPVILMSGDHNRYGTGVVPASSGPCINLSKPFSINELSSSIDSLFATPPKR